MKFMKPILIVSFVLLGSLLILSLIAPQNKMELPIAPNIQPKVTLENQDIRIYEQGSLIIQHPTVMQKFFISGTSVLSDEMKLSPFTLVYFLIVNALLLFGFTRKNTFFASRFVLGTLKWGVLGYMCIDMLLIQYYTVNVVKTLTDGAYKFKADTFTFYPFFYFTIALGVLLLNVQKGLALQKEQELTV